MMSIIGQPPNALSSDRKNTAISLAATGGPCKALPQYQTVLNYNATEEVKDKYNEAYRKCYPPTKTPAPTATNGPAPVPTEETPSPEPSVEPTADGG